MSVCVCAVDSQWSQLSKALWPQLWGGDEPSDKGKTDELTKLYVSDSKELASGLPWCDITMFKGSYV